MIPFTSDPSGDGGIGADVPDSTVVPTYRLYATDNLNVRFTPGGELVLVVGVGTKGTKIVGTETTQGNYRWIKVRFDNGVEGYVADSYTAPLTETVSGRDDEIRALIASLLEQIIALQVRLEEMRVGE